MSLLHTSHVVDDFLCEMQNFHQIDHQNPSDISRQSQPFVNMLNPLNKSHNNYSCFSPNQVIPEETDLDHSPELNQKSFIRLFNEMDDNAKS